MARARLVPQRKIVQIIAVLKVHFIDGAFDMSRQVLQVESKSRRSAIESTSAAHKTFGTVRRIFQLLFLA